MNYIDLFTIVLLVWAVFRGFTRGLIKQLTMLAALIFGIYAALKLSGFTAEQLESRWNVSQEFLYLVSLGLTFAIVFIGIHLIGNAIEKIAESVQLTLANRVLGIVFSVCRTVIIIGIILAFVDRIDHEKKFLPPNSREESFFYRPFTSVARAIFPALKISEVDNNVRKEVVINELEE